ncbi:hypothetical protein [Paenibacillus puldeungensis]|uniref:hypothetical protein n=1 Tax=Paenibacillus puldeungensis TaxID=696536 RepID=UPI0036D21378
MKYRFIIERSCLSFMVLGITIAAAVLIAVLLIVLMFYVTKKGYSRKWDEE